VLDAFAQIIVEYKLNLINVVYANDEYGVSIAEALIELSGDDFEIQLIRSFESADDVEDIDSILDDLEASPTSITFLSMTVIQTADFLNAAGARGMHDTHLWLSPNAVQVASDLDPPSTGGLWGISYGEELTEEAPLAQRYLAKDPAPHIEAQQYGFDENYNTLTYWGSYAYDAVLAAASGLAVATNISDGEEVLRAIRDLSLNITNTGNLEIDEHGDRVGARIPIFFVKPDGEADHTVDYLQTPLWPGGLTVQPTNLIRNEVNCKAGRYWSNSDQSCLPCSSLENITLSKEQLSFEGVSTTPVVDNAEIFINNDNQSPVSLHMKSTPPFVFYSGSMEDYEHQNVATVDPDNSQLLMFTSSSQNLAAGIAVGEIVLGVSDAGSYIECVGNDIRLEAVVNVSPEAQLNHLGAISAVGWTLAAVMILLTFFIAAWSIKQRKHPAIKKMQPPFLIALLFGVLVLGSTIIPLSIDDGVASERGCNISW
jgi:hypothetical protein